MLFRNKEENKIIFRAGRFLFIWLGKFRFHYSFYIGKTLFHGRFDFGKKHYRVLPVFATLPVIIFILAFGYNSSSAMIDNNAAFDEEADKIAKNADDKYLDETERQKMAIITAEEIREENEEKQKKLTVTPYTIQYGDTLSEIANRFGVPMDSIAGSSGIDIDSIIKPGQELLIPNKKGIVYRLKKGETLAQVASRYKVNIDDIASENNLGGLDIFQPGDKLFLPGAVVPDNNPKWMLPVASGIVTSGYGWRSYPRRKFHTALDLKARYEPVKAARAGKVIYSGWMGGYGKTVIIEHPGSIKTLYAHNSRLYVKKGEYVPGGKVISKSGCTGFCFGPHVHFEMIKKGRNVNPHKFLRGLSYKK